MGPDVDFMLRRLDQAALSGSSRGDILRTLRELDFADFARLLWSMPDQRYPALSALLPDMAAPEVQSAWTGTSGEPLLRQSVDFAQLAAQGFAEIAGRDLHGKKILDFGCGYGRMARLFYWFTDEDRYFGVDPWPSSLEACLMSGLTTNFLLSDEIPSSLPVQGADFDFIFAMSVFTHLSEKVAKVALETLMGHLGVGGVLLVTVRPPEFWDISPNASEQGLGPTLRAAHETHGFAFLPHDRPALEGQITYGDTSVAPKWLERHFPEL